MSYSLYSVCVCDLTTWLLEIKVTDLNTQGLRETWENSDFPTLNITLPFTFFQFVLE